MIRKFLAYTIAEIHEHGIAHLEFSSQIIAFWRNG